jgi:hypothetical protein
MMPETVGVMTNIVATSTIANFIISILLQIYAAKEVQSSSKSEGFSSPT